MLRLAKGSSEYPWHVVDDHDMPHVDLSIYASLSDTHHSPKTAAVYRRAVVEFAKWATTDPVVRRQGWNLFGEPEQVRNLVTHFLQVEMKCMVALRRNKLGFETRRVETNWSGRRRIPHLLAALRSLYNVLRIAGRYEHRNPMEGDHAAELIAAERQRVLQLFKETHGRHPMPSISGVDNVRIARTSAAHFRLRGGEWSPEIIDDVTIMNSIFAAGEKWGWGLREEGICRILFDTGGRISEVCALTIGDWQESQFGKWAPAINKGSQGQRVKRLFFSDRTVKVLRKYVEADRRALDESSRGINELLQLSRTEALGIPLFLTARGTGISPDHYRRDYWSPALEESGIRFRPHQSRHWVTTLLLNDIEENSKSKEEADLEKARLRHFMGWKSDMLPVYDQALQKSKVPALAARIHARIEEQQSKSISKQHKDAVSKRTGKTRLSKMLGEMLNNHEDP